MFLDSFYNFVNVVWQMGRRCKIFVRAADCQAVGLEPYVLGICEVIGVFIRNVIFRFRVAWWWIYPKILF